MKTKREFLSSRCISALVLLMVFVASVFVSASAATKAGTIIKNQASASYKDTLGIRRVATSNVVETVIRQIAAFDMMRSQTRPSAAGRQLYFVHSVANTGNGPDSFSLIANATGSGDFDFRNIAIYVDDDRDGQPDAFVPIAESHLLGPGDTQSFVVSGTIPPEALNDDVGSIRIDAQSSVDNAITQSNTDTGIVTDSAVIAVTKSFNTLQGSSPSGPVTVSIHYRNSSDSDATDVTLIDALPPGMSYVAGSGRWSESGSTVLTDSNPGDAQAGITYCAYTGSCTGLTEADSDTDSVSTNQVTAIIDTVVAGENGYIEFQVVVDSGLPSSTVSNTAELVYTAGGFVIGPIDSNTVPFRILRGAAVVINGSSTSSADGTGEPLEISDTIDGSNSNFPECLTSTSDLDGDGYGVESSVQCIVPNIQPGNAVFFKNTVWNLGNSIDTFDITTAASSFPAGTVFRILQSDGQTPLVDTSDNGIVDTGPVAPGGSYEIVLQVVLPVGVTGDNAGANFDVSTVATSVDDAVANNSMVNRLLNISGGSVDITNVAEIGDGLEIGVGAGPEVTPVSSVNVAPGTTATIDLFINNTSDLALDFDLSASIHSDFSSVELPGFWQLVFMLEDGTVVSNTGVIAPGDHVLVQAKITVPGDILSSVTSIYFKAENDVFAVSDIKHDEVVVTDQESVILGINQTGQTQAGGSRVYIHSLENSGNTDINIINLSLTDSLSAEGWTSLLYEDTDGNGALGSGDVPIDTTQLLAGELKTFFVKVFVPATAGAGQKNFTELVATWAAETLSVSDVTTVSTGEISVRKDQALDNGCDGILDSAYSRAAFAVTPGNNCVRYRLTATNAGAEVVLNVLVADATPTYTSYIGSASCSQTACAIVEPAVGAGGAIEASLPRLQAGDSVVVEFLVRVD